VCATRTGPGSTTRSRTGSTPASSTGAIGVTNAYALDHDLRQLGDLRRVAPEMTLGAPPQFQPSSAGLPLLEQVYGFTPSAFKPLDVGGQYQALDQGSVQAANVGTTDGELTTGHYTLLRDPRHAFGWGNVVPVVAARVIAAEGPAFTQTIDRVSALLTTNVLRRLNAAVDQSNQDPKVVAQQFLQQHGLVPPGGTGGP
jgi:osmoprotectant transport system substrate-binding protein